MASLVFSLYRCPCPNRVSGKGEAYFLFVFSLSLFLVFGSCYPYLLDISDVWWLQVSCCGRSLLVHSAGVTLRPSRHPLSIVLACSLDTFPLPQRIARLSLLCLLHASLMRLSGQIRSRAVYVFTSFFRAMSYTIFRCKVSDSGARQGRTSCFARKKSK